MQSPLIDRVHAALDGFRIELPSWGFANTGTRFGKFVQPAAAATIEEKFADAGHVHALTGACPTLALHVLWDFEDGSKACRQWPPLARAARRPPRLDQPESVPGPGLQIRLARQSRSRGSRASAVQHIVDSVQIAGALQQPRRLALVRRWFELSRHGQHPARASSGSKKAFARSTRGSHPTSGCWSNTSPSSRPSTTPTSPTGAWRCCSRAQPGRRHACWSTPGITTWRRTSSRSSPWLLAEDMLGGFHFNDRRYADDDLTLGSIDPYQIFRIFHEIRFVRIGDRRAAPTSRT